MKKASISKENLPQLKEPMQVEVLLSEELLARKIDVREPLGGF